MSLTLNGINVLTAKFTIPWRGVWVADLTLDLLDPALLPSGAGVLLNGTDSYVCFVDPRGSGTFVNFASVRVVGGVAGGWDKVLSPKNFAQPAALPSTVVYADTAASVSELPPVDSSPVNFGLSYTRPAGSAGAVFGDRDWYVDPTTGVVQVADWPSDTLDDGATIIDWDPVQQSASIVSTTLILPGTVLSDPRFNGQTYTVRDVEHEYGKTSIHATVWCSTQPVSRLQSAIQNAVRQFGQTQWLKTYAYRYVLGDPGAMALQAITSEAPDLNPIVQWTGLAGSVATLSPGTVVVVGFTGADPTQPYLVAVSPGSQTAPGLPTQTTIDAVENLSLGPSALQCELGGSATQTKISGGLFTLATGPGQQALLSALTTFAGACSVSITDPVLATAAGALKTALASVTPMAVTTLTKAT